MEKEKAPVKAKLVPNGPILIEGELEIIMTDKTVRKEKNPALCRCGHSKNKPFCDGSHAKMEWKE